MKILSLLARALAVLVLVFGLGLMLALSSCSQTYRWNQKVTLVVQTPDGVREEGHVVAIRLDDNTSRLNLPEARGARSYVTGEALAMEVAPDRYVFLLLGERSPSLPYWIFDDLQYVRKGGNGNIAKWVRKIRRRTEAVDIPVDRFPRIITFDDINDPNTVKELAPDAFEAEFGAGYALIGMKFQITKEPTTAGIIEGVLPWLATLDGHRLDGRDFGTIKAENRLANSLYLGYFKRDFK